MAQSESNKRQKYISALSDTLQIDTLSIIPFSIEVSNIDTQYYKILWYEAKWIWKKKPSVDSVLISYRVMPFFLSKNFFHKDAARIETNFAITPYYYDGVQANANAPFVDFGNVDYSGSFGRALSFGNSQDVVLNSQFNLQFEGDLGDSISLTGAITDNNIPFQPQGNTQQIQEFDRIFIKLQRKKTTIIAGDYDIKKPESYFMSFYKRVQGGFFSTQTQINKYISNKVGVGASLAKGKFVRNTITALEGNQGPYRLTGNNNEQFFIVLAGTERVYIDGVLMSRGEDQDYVIDYNTAEVTFMPRRLITKDLRLVIEFEFADRNYLNSLFYISDEVQIGNKLQVLFNIYSNQDAKNQPILQSLDSSHKRLMATVGDSIHQALYPAVTRIDTFAGNKVLYIRTDTVVAGNLYKDIYVYSQQKDSILYQVGFSFVGTGKGNYKQSVNSANGRVYAWIAPENGLLQGDFEPVLQLITPKKQQMITGRLQYQIDDNKSLMLETAMSNNDPNTFSKINNETHTGWAAKFIYTEKRFISKQKDLYIESGINYEYVQDRFKPLERFRTVEFNRDWNVNAIDKPQNEHLSSVRFSLVKSNRGNLSYQFGNYLRGNAFKGFQQVATLNYLHAGNRVMIKGDWIQQSTTLTNSNFYRPIIELEHTFKKLYNTLLGTKYFLEHNVLRDARQDTLLKSAFSFDALTFYVKNNHSTLNTFGAEYTYRRDRATANNEFKQATLGNTIALNAQIGSIKNQDIKFTTAWRTLAINDTTITQLKPEESLLGRVEYNFQFVKGLISGNLLYEMGAGQEPKREFTYVKVVAGQGQYVWRDYNKDSIEQLNEFELAIFPDEKLYIKIFTPTNQYVKAKYTVYNQALILNPKAILGSEQKSSIKKIIGLLYFQSAIQLSNRYIGMQGISQYNPFAHSGNDSLLINSNASVTHSVFINRFGNKWGIDYIRLNTTLRTLMTYGVDGRNQLEHTLRFRYNVYKQFVVNMILKQGNRQFSSAFLENRDFFIDNKVIEPGINWLLRKNQLRIQCSYKYDLRQNKMNLGGEKAVADYYNSEIRYNIISSGSINTKITYANIQYDGNSNNSLGYAMLDGLQNGKNWLWNVGLDKRLSKNVEMSIQYEGRKPATSNAIHTGRATLRAIF